jgi:hypothetical protein
MRLAVFLETGEADQGYEEGEEPTFEQHCENIRELLRSGYYEVDYIDEARDGE